jgi:hypothetical protein
VKENGRYIIKIDGEDIVEKLNGAITDASAAA